MISEYRHNRLYFDLENLFIALRDRPNAEAQDLALQAEANLKCYGQFAGISETERQDFLDTAYRLQARAWLRVQGRIS